MINPCISEKELDLKHRTLVIGRQLTLKGMQISRPDHLAVRTGNLPPIANPSYGHLVLSNQCVMPLVSVESRLACLLAR